MLRHDCSKNWDKRACGACDLKFRTAKRGDNRAADDGGPQALLRGDAGSDSETDRQREGDDANGNSGAEILEEISFGVTV